MTNNYFCGEPYLTDNLKIPFEKTLKYNVGAITLMSGGEILYLLSS